MKITEIYESTTSGSVATVAQPMTTQARNASIYGDKKAGNLLTGKKTNKKYANKKYANSVSESGMPASVLKNKQKLAGMTDNELASHLKGKSDDELKQMAWRHGYGKMSPHYVNRIKKVTENVKKPVRESVGYPGIKDDEELREFQQYPDAFSLYNKLRKDGVAFTKVHPRGKNRVDFDIVMNDRRHSLQMRAPGAMYEAQLDEEDLILVPGQGHRFKTGFIPHGESRVDHEVEMAKSDLFSAAKNAKQVYEMIADISEEEGLEGWVQEKIIKANDYLNTIREYLEGKQLQEMTGGVIAGGGVSEGTEDWEMRVQSLPRTSELKLKAITATSPGPMPKRYTFDTEKEAIQHFGQQNWQFIKSGTPDKYGDSWKVEYQDSVKEGRVLGRGMSPEARARDIEQSDIEYIEQRQFKEKWKKDNPGKKWPGYDEAGFKSRYGAKV
jgi:hypothetical protein